jgi:hypothetical protein
MPKHLRGAKCPLVVFPKWKSGNRISGIGSILDLNFHQHALTYCKLDSFKERAGISDNWRQLRRVAKASLGTNTKEIVCGRRFPTQTFRKLSEFKTYLADTPEGRLCGSYRNYSPRGLSIIYISQ